MNCLIDQSLESQQGVELVEQVDWGKKMFFINTHVSFYK